MKKARHLIRLGATAALYAVLSFGPDLTAQDSVKTEAGFDARSPKAAAFSMATALMLGEEEIAYKLWANDRDRFQPYVRQFKEWVNAKAELVRLASQRFGSEAKVIEGFVAMPPRVTTERKSYHMLQLIAGGEVDIQDRTATITLADHSKIRLVSDGNSWRVQTWPSWVEVIGGLQLERKTYELVASRLENGQYTNMAELFFDLHKAFVEAATIGLTPEEPPDTRLR